MWLEDINFGCVKFKDMKKNKLTYRELGKKYLSPEDHEKYEKNVLAWVFDIECGLEDEKMFLGSSFIWGESKEGYEYWAGINYNLNK
jgi:hypothetical protein